MLCQFFIKGFYQPFRLDISRNSGGLLIYIKSTLPAKFLFNYTLPSNIQAIPFELYKKIDSFLALINRPLKTYTSWILFLICNEYKVIFGDFNMNPVKSEMNTFLNTATRTKLIEENTWCKGTVSCVDLIFTIFK